MRCSVCGWRLSLTDNFLFLMFLHVELLSPSRRYWRSYSELNSEHVFCEPVGPESVVWCNCGRGNSLYYSGNSVYWMCLLWTSLFIFAKIQKFDYPNRLRDIFWVWISESLGILKWICIFFFFSIGGSYWWDTKQIWINQRIIKFRIIELPVYIYSQMCNLLMHLICVCKKIKRITK